jgi:imidazolonepropionase-like amidohydrolase
MQAYGAQRVFDGERLLDGPATVLVDGGRVLGVQSAGQQLPAGCELTAFGDATLLPGLVDAHVHLCADSTMGALDRIPDPTDEEMAGVIERSLRLQVAAGVTTVRDLGDRRYAVLEWRDAHRADDPELPRVLGSGPPITLPEGHCSNMGGGVAGLDALVAAVRQRAERGADVVKIMASGGVNTPGSDAAKPQFDVDEVRAVVTEAHHVGLAVTAHAHAVDVIRDVLSAGVDMVEHASFITQTGMTVDDSAVATMAATGTPVCPTLGFLPGAAPPPPVLAMMERTGMTHEKRVAAFVGMHRAGVRLVAGSDAGINPGKRHGVLRESLIHLAQGGVSVIDALASGTSVAADVLGLAAETGRLRPGLAADLLVVDGDLFADVARLRDVVAVVLRGRRMV